MLKIGPLLALVWLAFAAPAVGQPLVLYPGDGEINVSVNPPLQIICDETVIGGHYQIASSDSFSAPVYDSGGQLSDICNHVALANLGRGTTYHWRARIQTPDGNWSGWSGGSSFTTVGPEVRVGRLELRDGSQGYSGNADTDIRGSFSDPETAIRDWNQGLQTILRTGRRPAGASTDEIYRTLIKFDLARVTPATPVISAYLELVGEGQHSDSVDFHHPSRAYRLLVPWQEWNPDGNDDGCCGAVEDGEASWTYRSKPEVWHAPGAAGIEVDRTFDPVFITRFRNLPGHVTRSGNGVLLPVVQQWIDNPEENHGLILVAADESLQRTMNLASSDHADPASRPAMILELAVNELIDLSLALPAPMEQPVVGEPFDLELVLHNAGPDAASGVVTQVDLPSGYTLGGHIAQSGVFDPATSVWAVSDLSAGQSTTLTLTGTYPEASLEVRAAVTSADQLDADSYPDNFTNEDDDASVLVTLSEPDPGSGGDVLLQAAFDSGSGEFSYLDDLFNGTSASGYARGSFDSGGGFSGGGLVVELGGVDNATVADMSGGWRYGFSLAGAATVRFSFRYRLTDSGTFEGSECTQLLAAVNGVLSPSGVAIDQICGTDPQSNTPQDTGWQQSSFEMLLEAGNHTLDLGGYTNLKTRVNEVARVYLDDVEITLTDSGTVEDALSVTPSSLSLGALTGSTASESLQVSTTAGAQVSVTVSGDADWLVPITGGTTPFSTEVAADAGTLAAGEYTATISVAASGYETVLVPVTFTVTEPEPDPGSGGDVLLQAAFDSGSGEFSYLDDLFNGTSASGYARGSFDSGGGFSGGGLVVELGGVDNATVADMSGGWRYGFSLASSSTVRFSFRYRLTDSGTFEGSECTQLLAAVNGALSPSGVALDQICGTDPQSNTPQDTGWQQSSFEMLLEAGDHTFDLGGYTNLKTRVNEVARVYLDEVEITLTDTGTVEDALSVTPSSLSLGALTGSTASESLQVSTTAGAQVSVTVSGDADWLVPIAGGTAPFSTEVTADAGTLAVGEYTATVSVAASGYDTVFVPVTFTVSEPDPDPDPVVEGEVLLDATFESDLDGFAYLDDLFRDTSEPSYASGTRLNNGGESGAGLEVRLGGGGGTVVGMSGGFVRSFTIDQEQYVVLELSYRHFDSGTYEADECSHLLVAMDGVHLSTTARDHLSEFCGDEPQSNTASDTEWRRFRIPLFLTAGTHTLALGGYNSQKTSSNERTWLRFDNVRIETGFQEIAALETSVEQIDLALTAGTGDTRSVEVVRSGGGNTVFEMTSNVPWAIPSVASGGTPETVSILIDSAGLPSGTRTGVIRASAEGHNDATVGIRLMVD